MREPDVERRRVGEALAYFDLTPVDLAAVENSFSSTVRIVKLAGGERLVLKIPYVRRKLLREHRALTVLHDDLPVPKVIDVWVPDDDRPGALLLSHLSGAPVQCVTPTLARAMGDLLARLHLHTLDHYGEVVEPAETPLAWWAMLHRHFEGWKTHCARVLDPALYTEVVKLYEARYAALPEPDGPRWTHFDFRPGNVLAAGSRITGLIDFESARGGSADLDVVWMQSRVWSTAPETKVPFLEAYAAVRPLPPIAATLPFYQLHHAFGGIAWCVRRTDTDDPFFRENLILLKACLAESS